MEEPNVKEIRTCLIRLRALALNAWRRFLGDGGVAGCALAECICDAASTSLDGDFEAGDLSRASNRKRIEENWIVRGEERQPYRARRQTLSTLGSDETEAYGEGT